MRNETSHVLHLIITVFFFPWIIVWILCYFYNEEKTTEKKPKKKPYNNWPK